MADRGQLEQVLLNLAVNARDAMPGGGRLSIDISNVDIDNEFARRHPGLAPGPFVRLAVSDTGIGMSPEICARVFEPFFTTKGQGKGTGLGLATVHSVVTEHHGCITATSEEGHGATFNVFLPRVDTPPPASADEAAPRSGTETILIAEDERALRELTAKMLGSVGYTVIPAESGPQALATARSSGAHVDLLLTNVVMPGMSGPELAAELGRTHAHISVLFMSGYTDDKLTLSELDLRHFIPKPFTLVQLTQAIRRVLDAPGRMRG